jgi:molybdenum cofactor synthesis domain-containing protein
VHPARHNVCNTRPLHTEQFSPVPSNDPVTAAILVIGDEILSGRTKDKNIGTIAEHLTGIGVRLCEVRIVADVEDEIVAALNALRQRFEYIFTTGGIGPTHDDITADSVARAFGVGIDIDPRARAVLQNYYDQRGLELTAARLRMARIPDGASLIENSVSGAPGFQIGNVIVMAGVPDIMASMLQAVTPTLRTGRKMRSVTVLVQRPESEIAALLGAHQKRFPRVAMGSYPRMIGDRYASELVLRCDDAEQLAEAEVTLRQGLDRL